jgi:AcrR family transcriptional regulator
MKTRQRRSSPMPVEDRRRAIIDAVTPLLIEKGATVTTAEMAEAAGIAEGTIFRAFPDKHMLIVEALKAAMDPRDVVEAIQGIDRSAALDAQLTIAARVLRDQLARVVAIMEVLRSMPMPGKDRKSEGMRLIRESSAAVSAALSDLLEPHRKELRFDIGKAIAALRGLIFASGHSLVPRAERLTVDEVVGILLSGVLRKGKR